MMLLKRILKIWINYAKSQLILILFIGILTYVYAKAIGIPYPLVMAVLAAIGEGVSQIGPILATVPPVVFALWKGSSILSIPNWGFALIVAAGYILIQQLENWIIKPKLIGSMLDLHPLLALIGMTAAGIFFGIPGVLLAIPVMVTIREAIHYFFYEDRNLPKKDQIK